MSHEKEILKIRNWNKLLKKKDLSDAEYKAILTQISSKIIENHLSMNTLEAVKDYCLNKNMTPNRMNQILKIILSNNHTDSDIKNIRKGKAWNKGLILKNMDNKTVYGNVLNNILDDSGQFSQKGLNETKMEVRFKKLLKSLAPCNASNSMNRDLISVPYRYSKSMQKKKQNQKRNLHSKEKTQQILIETMKRVKKEKLEYYKKSRNKLSRILRNSRKQTRKDFSRDMGTPEFGNRSSIYNTRGRKLPSLTDRNLYSRSFDSQQRNSLKNGEYPQKSVSTDISKTNTSDKYNSSFRVQKPNMMLLMKFKKVANKFNKKFENLKDSALKTNSSSKCLQNEVLNTQRSNKNSYSDMIALTAELSKGQYSNLM